MKTIDIIIILILIAGFGIPLASFPVTQYDNTGWWLSGLCQLVAVVALLLAEREVLKDD